MQSSKHDVKQVLEAIFGFTNTFSSSVEDNELYCLSSGVPAKPDIAKDLLDAEDIGRKAMEDFINSSLVDKSVGFHNPIKRNKLKTFAACEVKKKLTSLQNKTSQIRAERNVFDQLVLLSTEHNVDLELTLSFPLGPVPWSLATADGMPTKTDKSKHLHFLESHIEQQSIDYPMLYISLMVMPYYRASRNWWNLYSTSYQRQSVFILSLIHISRSLYSLTNVHAGEHFCCLVQKVGHHVTGRPL